MAGRYHPIGEYGVIGDLYSAALVSMDGSIDFLCLPHFDSPSVFAALVDVERGGRFQIAPLLAGAARKQLYLPDTNVLLTRFPRCRRCGRGFRFHAGGRRGAGAHRGAAGEDGAGRGALSDALRSTLRLEVGQDLLGQRVTAVEPSGSSSRARAVSHRMKAPASSV